MEPLKNIRNVSQSHMLKGHSGFHFDNGFDWNKTVVIDWRQGEKVVVSIWCKMKTDWSIRLGPWNNEEGIYLSLLRRSY